MANLTTSDVESQFDLLVRAMTKLGTDTDEWELLPGEMDGSDRRPWEVHIGKPRGLTLGYTRAEAHRALVSMNAIVSIVEL